MSPDATIVLEVLDERAKRLERAVHWWLLVLKKKCFYIKFGWSSQNYQGGLDPAAGSDQSGLELCSDECMMWV